MIPGQIAPILFQRDSERSAQVSRSPTEIPRGHISTSHRPAPTHQVESVKRLERSNQHRRWHAFGLGDGVDQVVNAVVEIDVGTTWRAVERRVSGGESSRRVTGGVLFPDIGLDFDDRARRRPSRRGMHEYLADQIVRDGQRVSGVEPRGQDRSHCSRRHAISLRRLRRRRTRRFDLRPELA